MNILVFSSRYPEMDLGLNKNTEFMQVFAIEWVRQGHNVLVCHTKPSFLKPVDRAIKAAAPFLKSNKSLAEYLSVEMPGGDSEYTYGGVPVLRKKVHKLLPKMLSMGRNVRAAEECVLSYLKKNGFSPDVVVADFINPSMLVARRVLTRCPAPSVAVLHSTDLGYLRMPHTAAHALRLVKEFTCVAFRSLPAKEAFEKRYFKPPCQLIWYSGVPDSRMVAKGERRPRSRARTFIAVGRLIARKHFDAVIRAFDRTCHTREYKLNLIGEGPEREALEELAASLASRDQIHFLGKLPRADVLNRMAEADVFVMIPHDETFGMVYVEALSRGCVVVGAALTGVDGIIRNGINGWLLEPGDEAGLTGLLRHIVSLSEEEIGAISQNAYETTAAMSDSALAAGIAERFGQLAKNFTGAFSAKVGECARKA